MDNLGPLRRKLSLPVSTIRAFDVAVLGPGDLASMARIQAVTSAGVVRTLAPGYPASLLEPLAADLRQRCGLAEAAPLAFGSPEGLPDEVPPPAR